MELQDCRIRWDTQSRNSAESMPVGGYDTGANVWVEKAQVFFYLQQSGWFDENNSLLKAGRFRMKIEPNPFEGEFFQELLPEQGTVRIGGAGDAITSASGQRNLTEACLPLTRRWAVKARGAMTGFSTRQIIACGEEAAIPFRIRGFFTGRC